MDHLLEVSSRRCHHGGMRVIGITELNQQTSRVIKEVKDGARVDVTMHGRVVARIVPATPGTTWLDQKKAEGRVQPPADVDAELPALVPVRSGLTLDQLIDEMKGDD